MNEQSVKKKAPRKYWGLIKIRFNLFHLKCFQKLRSEISFPEIFILHEL